MKVRITAPIEETGLDPKMYEQGQVVEVVPFNGSVVTIVVPTIYHLATGWFERVEE